MSGTTLPNSSLSSAIQRLKDATAMLPESTPEGSMDGVVWRSFSTRPQDVKGPIFTTVNEALSECFLSDTSLGLARVLRGTFGMDVVIRCLEECAKYPTMSSSDLYILELKIGQLTGLVYHRIKSLPSGNKSLATRKRKRPSKATKPAKRVSKYPKTTANDNNNTSDSDYEPEGASDHTSLNSLDSDDNYIHKAETITRSVDASRPQSPTDNDTGLAGVEVQGRLGKRPGPKDETRQWALANWKEPIATWNPNTNQPCWLFRCKYCDSIRRFNRLQDCFDFSLERKSLNSANLANHLKSQCRKIPPEQKFDAFRARLRGRSEVLTSAQQSIGEMFKCSTPAPTGSLSLSQTSFRSTLIQGVIRDNYPLTFGEGKGMQMIFSLLSPSIQLPCHQTMRQDLSQLFGILTKRMRQLLQSQKSRFAISSDAWTSKTFMYSISGVIVTFIDKNWNLQELLLDVIHLDADHTGKGMGQRLFRSLDRMGAAERIIASMTDNASNNLTMNEELSGRIRDKFELALNVKNMSVTCLCHALHLICGAILERVKAVDPPESDEAYAAFKLSDNQQTVEEQAEIQDYEEIHYNNDWDS